MNPKALRFLADESCDFVVVRALRTAGYDVSTVVEVMASARDADVIEYSAREQRILLTEDKDFGWLVFVSNAQSAGVILVRYPVNARSYLGQDVVKLVQAHGQSLTGCFVVMQPGQVRINRKP